MNTRTIRNLTLSTMLMTAISSYALAVPLLNGFGGDRNYGALAM